MGTPAFALPTLEALLQSGHDVVAVYTRPPAPSGRRRQIVPSPVHRMADQAGLRVLTPAGLRTGEAAADFRALGADVAVVAAYGIILPPSILSAPPLGCLNVHGSLLPRWRGAAPVQRAILAGDAETGVTIMRMDAGMDTGEMLSIGRVPVHPYSSGDLHEILAQMGARLMMEVLGDPSSHPPVKQPLEGVTIARKIDKAETRLDFTRPAVQVERAIRAYSPSPGAWTTIRGERVRMLRSELACAYGPPGAILDNRLTIACGTGAIRPTVLQRAGRGLCTGEQLAHSLRLAPGDILSQCEPAADEGPGEGGSLRSTG